MLRVGCSYVGWVVECPVAPTGGGRLVLVPEHHSFCERATQHSAVEHRGGCATLVPHSSLRVFGGGTGATNSVSWILAVTSGFQHKANATL
eukprot:scaffold3380_cov118-Isochrysis_galbana.AAC.1